MTRRIVLSGGTTPTTYTTPLTQGERADLCDEATWRSAQYYDALANGPADMVRPLRARLREVEELLA